MSPSSGGQSGTQGGRATGQRGVGPETPHDFEREKPGAKSGIQRGQTVGAFQTDGEADKGEVSVPRSPEFSGALKDASEKVDGEPLPVEVKQIVERYYESLLRGGAVFDGADAKGAGANGAGG